MFGWFSSIGLCCFTGETGELLRLLGLEIAMSLCCVKDGAAVVATYLLYCWELLSLVMVTESPRFGVIGSLAIVECDGNVLATVSFTSVGFTPSSSTSVLLSFDWFSFPLAVLLSLFSIDVDSSPCLVDNGSAILTFS